MDRQHLRKKFRRGVWQPDTSLKAQYRFRVSIAKGFYNGQPSVKIQVFKEQLVQRDVLEGWRPVVDEDQVDEKTLLYRIGRLIYIKMKLAILEEQKASGGVPPASSDAPPPAEAPPPESPPADSNPPPETSPESQPEKSPPQNQDTKELDLLEKQ
jgi:hypothetical protein